MQIKFEQVSYIYQPGSIAETAALHGIDLSVASGELVALIGASGSGKSTLALLAAGLYRPGSGRVIVGDRQADQQFRSVGLVFQYPEQQLFGENVFEEVAFGAKNFGTPTDYLPVKVRQALEEVGLDADALWRRSPFSLSGGQMRRVCIAGVLATNPRFLILDEPTAGMDEGGRRWMIELVRKLNKKGRTVIWITHDMEEAATVAGRIIVLDQGRIMLDAAAGEVFNQEEALRNANLDIPQAAKLVRELKARGIAVAGEAINVEGAYEEISAWLRSPAPEAQSLEYAEEIAAGGLPQNIFASAEESAVDEDELWEKQAAEELRALVGVEQAAAPEFQPEPQQNEQPAVDFDLTGLTGEESPQVPEWRGGEEDV